MTQPPITIESGELLALRLFDVAFAIDLAAAERLWSTRAGSPGSRSRLTTAPPKALAFDVPPLRLVLEPFEVAIGGETVSVQLTARLYDFGVIALALRAAVTHATWPVFSQRFNAFDAALGDERGASLWLEQLRKVTERVGAAFERPSAAFVQEDYLIGIVRAFDRPFEGAVLREQVDLVGLLSGESRALSAMEQRELLQRSFSYFADDLVVLTWDRAFIYEPRGDFDVADVIEVANAQLVEFRYYDELLDLELPRMYDRVATAQRAAHRFAQLARQQYTLVAEVTELRERIDNALQVTEDVYLARVYAAALDLFRVPSVSAAVDRKLAIMRDTYAALYDEASSRRAELLEIAIVLLIVIEIALALVKP